MQSFRFRLERVLSWRRKQRQIEENRLAQRIAAAASVRGQIVRLREERSSTELATIQSPVLSANDLFALGLYRLGARQREQLLESQRAQCDREVAEQQRVLQAADRKVRLLEKLRERRQAEHDYAFQQEMEALAAESYLAKWSRERASDAGETSPAA